MNETGVSLADLQTAAQVFLRRYTALDCSADRMALREEKFFSCLHSCITKNTSTFISVFSIVKTNFYLLKEPNLSNNDPPLNETSSVGGACVSAARRVQCGGGGLRGGGGVGWRGGRGDGGAVGGRAEEGGDDAVGDGVELGDGGADGGRQAPFFLLVPLRPDAAQAVERHHVDKQLLRDTHGDRRQWKTQSGGGSSF